MDEEIEVTYQENWGQEKDLVYNRLTAFKLFAMTSSMVISVNELVHLVRLDLLHYFIY